MKKNRLFKLVASVSCVALICCAGVAMSGCGEKEPLKIGYTYADSAVMGMCGKVAEETGASITPLKISTSTFKAWTTPQESSEDVDIIIMSGTEEINSFSDGLFVEAYEYAEHEPVFVVLKGNPYDVEPWPVVNETFNEKYTDRRLCALSVICKRAFGDDLYHDLSIIAPIEKNEHYTDYGVVWKEEAEAHMVSNPDNFRAIEIMDVEGLEDYTTHICIAITKNCKDVDAAEEFVDYFYSDEGKANWTSYSGIDAQNAVKTEVSL